MLSNNNIPGIIIKQFGLSCFIVNASILNDIEADRNGLTEVSSILKAGKFDEVVLD